MSYIGTNGGNTRLAQALPNWKYAFSSQIGLHTTEFPAGRSLTSLFQFLNSRTTHGSYHAASDAHGNSGQYCPWSWGAWHAPSINRHSVGVSGNCRADEWDRISTSYRDNLINGMARQAHRYSRWQVANGRAPVPARMLTKAQAERREPGFVYHGSLQADRTDPYGPRDIFPWSQFLTEYRRLESGGTVLEGEVMSWSDRTYDYVNEDETTARHQLAKAHEYGWSIWSRIRNNDWRKWLWRHRGYDYVNDNANTKDHQIARAHQYSMQARSEAREVKAMVKAMAKAQDELLQGQGKILKAVEDAEVQVVKANAAEVAAELEVNVKEEEEG